MKFVGAFFRLVVGLLFGAGSTLALSPAFAAFNSGENSSSPIAMLVPILLGGLLGLFAPTIRRAFGRGFLLLGVSTFALPISTTLLSGRAVSEVVGSAGTGNEAAAAAGAGIAAVAMTGVATFVGVILGAIFLIVGLVLALGGRREVIVVKTVG